MNKRPDELKKIEEENQWIKAFQAGEKEAFDRLVLRYQDRIYNLCIRMMGEREEADDCAQETFVKAYRSLNRFRFESSFSTWIYTVAVNTCKNRLNSLDYRQKARMVSISSPYGKEDDAIDLEIEDPAPTPLAQLARKERDRIVMEAIDTLSDDSKIVVTLRDVEGLAYEEIARITGYNLGTVKSKLARARQQLREWLKGVI